MYVCATVCVSVCVRVCVCVCVCVYAKYVVLIVFRCVILLEARCRGDNYHKLTCYYLFLLWSWLYLFITQFWIPRGGFDVQRLAH